MITRAVSLFLRLGAIHTSFFQGAGMPCWRGMSVVIAVDLFEVLTLDCQHINKIGGKTADGTHRVNREPRWRSNERFRAVRARRQASDTARNGQDLQRHS